MSVVPVRDDELSTTTLRVAFVTALLLDDEIRDSGLTTAEIARLTGLTDGGAWAMMDRLAGSHHVPFTFVDGKWRINRR